MGSLSNRALLVNDSRVRLATMLPEDTLLY
jgi:hypothetical protein